MRKAGATTSNCQTPSDLQACLVERLLIFPVWIAHPGARGKNNQHNAHQRPNVAFAKGRARR